MEKKDRKIYDSMRDAIMIGDCDWLAKLLLKGADPNMSSDTGWSVMHTAAIYKPECLKLLIAAGADPLKADNFGCTVLHQAVTGVAEDCVKTLIPFYINAGKLNITDNYGQTPVHYAAWYGWPKILDIIIKAGADIGIEENSGRTPLHLAVEKDHSGCAVSLLEAGADIEHRNRQGETPLYVSIRMNKSRCTSLLMDSGANVCVSSPYGWNCLHEAAYHGRTGLMRRLIKAGADLEGTYSTGQMPLDILKEKYPVKHRKYAQGISELFVKIRNARLKKEDMRKTSNTGYEFDI